ncbi:hypothetical protein HPB51_011762 [Rhipicephalus microplus]|uniref:Uncharacterized protein n=1 Tax=Rhipicephalus microplus TaxID=6941 RepID=A0A9J6DMF9_RHIMP|nr:hypothetical protein HPB51_011762 [Rhipicephalus microplus]
MLCSSISGATRQATDESFSSASSDDDVTSDEMQFESPRPPRFRDKTAAQLGLAKASCRDKKGRPGRNCHTYSKGAGFSLANDGDYSRLPTEKSGRRLPAFWDEFVVPLVKVVEKSVNSSLQDTQPIDGNVVEAVESIGTLLAEANKLDFRQVAGRTHYASFPGDGDAGEKSSVLPEEFLQWAQLGETEVGSVRPATTTEYLRDQYSRLRQLFLQPLGKVLSTLQSFPVSAEHINIVIYTEVKIGAPVCTINGVGHKSFTAKYCGEVSKTENRDI